MSNNNINEKREMIIYVTILLWIIFAIAAPMYMVSFSDISIYFVSLTGFISAYIWGESVRKSNSTSVFKSGASSSREKMMYIVILLWLLLGVYGFFKHLDFTSLAAYFSVLTPFVGAYILGKTFKPSTKSEDIDPQTINNTQATTDTNITTQVNPVANSQSDTTNSTNNEII